jgi:SNF2 family DNA or RNA helicase
MQIIDNKALLLRVKQPEHLLAALDHAERVGPNDVLVKWDLNQAKRLRDMGIKAPSPIEGRYNWPGKFTPMAHQKTTSAFLTLNHAAFCFSEQGVGKTASAIWAADYLMTIGAVRRVLVICPVSIMDVAWRADLFTVAMHRTVAIAHGSAEKRRKVLAQGSEFVVINFDGVDVVQRELAAGGFDLVIVDECTGLKNAQTKRWKVLKNLLQTLGNPRLWMMTGTPAAQGPEDAYGLAKLVNPKGVPRTFGSFKDMVMIKISQFKWEPRPESHEIVHRALQPAIRFTKEECLDLPEQLYVKREVELTRQQRKYYELLRKELVMEAAGSVVTAVNAAVQMNKLLQVSAGAVYDTEGNTLEFDIRHRYSVMEEAIAEAAKKVLIFVPYIHVIDLLTDKMRADGYTVDIIRGDVPVNRRTEIFNRFQREKNPQVLLIQPQAAAHGVTLTAADTVIWWGPVASMEIYAQANARVHRAGQAHKCTVVQLQGSPVERKLYAMLDRRVEANTRLVDLYKEVLD